MMKYLQTTTINGVVIGNARERTEEDVNDLIEKLPLFENEDRKIDFNYNNGNYVITITIRDCGKVVAKFETKGGDTNENQN